MVKFREGKVVVFGVSYSSARGREQLIKWEEEIGWKKDIREGEKKQV